jgi:hypothetical protein
LKFVASSDIIIIGLKRLDFTIIVMGAEADPASVELRLFVLGAVEFDSDSRSLAPQMTRISLSMRHMSRITTCDDILE